MWLMINLKFANKVKFYNKLSKKKKKIKYIWNCRWDNNGLAKK